MSSINIFIFKDINKKLGKNTIFANIYHQLLIRRL
jgi:hypothetical protein